MFKAPSWLGRVRRVGFLLSLVLGLQACGGGGGSTSSDSTPVTPAPAPSATSTYGLSLPRSGLAPADLAVLVAEGD
ncbi:MAG: hypothetical protein O9341_25800, partial [Paucibacter sp.]|nr:hypothetical protein [Roseateles sp.]